MPRRAALSVLVTVSVWGAAACSAQGESPDSGEEHDSGAVVWVAAERADALTLLDADTGDVLATVDGIAAPHNVQAAPDEGSVWATTSGGVVQVDAAKAYAMAAAPSGEHPAHVVGGPGGTVWVSAHGEGAVYEHDAELGSSRRHDIGGGPHGMRISEDEELAAVANTLAGTVDLIDLTALAITDDHSHHGQDASRADAEVPVRSVRVGPGPIQTAITADSLTVFVSVSGASQVVRVDAASGKVTGRVEVPAGPAQVWVTRSGLLLSANQGTPEAPGRSLSIIDAESLEVLAEVDTGAGPHGVVVDEEERFAWVTNSFDDTVTRVDLAARKAVLTVPVGAGPNGITISGTSLAADVDNELTLLLPPAFAPGDSGHDDAHDH